MAAALTPDRQHDQDPGPAPALNKPIISYANPSAPASLNTSEHKGPLARAPASRPKRGARETSTDTLAKSRKHH